MSEFMRQQSMMGLFAIGGAIGLLAVAALILIRMYNNNSNEEAAPRPGD